MEQAKYDKSRVCQIPPIEKRSVLWHQRPVTTMMGRNQIGSWKSTLFFILAGALLIVQIIIDAISVGLQYNSFGDYYFQPIPVFFAISAFSMFIGAWFSRPGGSDWYKDYVRNSSTKLNSTMKDSFTREITNIAPFWGFLGVSLAFMWAVLSFQPVDVEYWWAWDLPQTLGFAGGLVGVLAIISSSRDHKGPSD
ncbi:MAG: hypothetical protein ACFFCP_05030 [Promethearchaeota archaeon]